MTSSINLMIDSDLDKVSLIARAVRTICAELLPEAELDAVELSLVEAINNVIKHGYHGEPGKDVGVTVRLTMDSVELEVVDHAPPMQPEVLAQATENRFDFDETDLANIPEGGMGLALIRMNMDEVEYISGGGENRLRMVKKVTSPAS